MKQHISFPAITILLSVLLPVLPGIPGVSACDSTLSASPDSSRSLQPAPLVGFGATTTGGRNGAFVPVTETGDDAGTAGTIRWALQQHNGEPLYIALAVEGEIALGSQLTIRRPNLTIDGRFAPGRGCWFTGERMEIEADNVFLDHVVHYGNDPSPDGASDCLRWGDYNGSEDCYRGYVRNCEFYHGADEVFAFTPRSNGAATGRTVSNVTLEKTIIANPSGINGHPLLYFIGDGVNGVTNYHVLMATANARFPFVRQYADDIEFINCAAYNFNENAAAVVEDAGIDFRGCLYRLGPRWQDTRAPFKLDPGTNVYLEDVITDSKSGKVNSYGLTRDAEARTSSQITQSGLEPQPAGTVADDIAAYCGAPLYDGERDTATLAVLHGFYYGCGPDDLLAGYGPERTATGAVYPAVNGNGVPLNYLASYPPDTDPEMIIAEGSAWDGYMVAERIGAWLVSVKETAAIARQHMPGRTGTVGSRQLYTVDGRIVTGNRPGRGVYVRTDGINGAEAVLITE